MSYWVYLHCRKQDDPASWELAAVAPFTDGGTYPVGGTDRAEVNITYNYGELIYEALGVGLRALDEQRAGDWIARLTGAVEKLGTARDRDYWAATPGNAGAALARLLAWAREYPDGVFSVS